MMALMPPLGYIGRVRASDLFIQGQAANGELQRTKDKAFLLV